MRKMLGNWEAKNANPPFVQSTHKAVRACKLFLLLQRSIGSAMEIHVKTCKPHHGTIVALMQTTYEQEAVGIGRPKTQTLRLCNQHTKWYELPKLFLLHHRHIKSPMEIRLNSLQTPPRNNSCTNANYI